MRAGYMVYNGDLWSEQRFFVVANYAPLNFIKTYGFKYMPNKTKYDIGVWKIKQLKQI